MIPAKVARLGRSPSLVASSRFVLPVASASQLPQVWAQQHQLGQQRGFFKSLFGFFGGKDEKVENATSAAPAPEPFNPPVKIRVGGVPEHFNIPWHDAMEDLKKAGIDVEWHMQPGGTGAMTKGLRDGSLDAVIALTEGLIADLARGNPSKLVAQYVQSSLLWGVHVASGSSFKDIEGLRGKRFGISRVNSGSHLMAFVLAKQQGWDPKEIEFVIVGSLDGAREAFKEDKIDAFMWEQFTTKPHVYTGEWRCVGVQPTPWPCFAVAVRNQVLETNPDAVRRMQEIVEEHSARFQDGGSDSVRRVTEDFGIKADDAAEWFAGTRWSQGVKVDDQMLEDAVETLREVGVLEADLKIDAKSLVKTV